MKKIKTVITRWGCLWSQRNKLDGVTEHLIYDNCLPALFITKREATKYIQKNYGYIAKRKDLRVEPHCWRVPKPVKVTITYITNNGGNE